MQRVMTLNNVLSRLSLRSSDLSFGPLSTCRWNSTATPDSVAFLQQAAYNKQQSTWDLHIRREKKGKEAIIRIEMGSLCGTVC